MLAQAILMLHITVVCYQSYAAQSCAKWWVAELLCCTLLTTKSNLFAAGVLPFQGSSSGPSLLTKKMMDDMASSRFHYPEGVQVSAGARDLIKKILQADPKQRATAAQIQQHPWFLPGYTTPRQLGVISPQTEADITRIVQAARVQPVRSRRHFIEDEIEE